MNTSWGVIWSFSRASYDCLHTAFCTPVVTIIRGLTYHLAILNVDMRGLYLFFSLLWPYLGIYHGSRWIMWIVGCLMGLGGWVYGYPWGPLVNILFRVLSRPCMCMCWRDMCIGLTIPRLWRLGTNCVDCLECNTFCVVGLSVGDIWCIALLCRARPCEGLCVWVNRRGE